MTGGEAHDVRSSVARTKGPGVGETRTIDDAWRPGAPTVDETEEVEIGLHDVLVKEAPQPTSEFRERAWQTFQAALDRHLASKPRPR